MTDCRENQQREALLTELGNAFAKAVLAGDEVAAEIAIRDAINARLRSAEIDEEIIAPALWLVGRLWERGEISIAEEHLATEISLRVLALQREAQRTARARGAYRVMLAAVGGEHHIVALRMIANLLGDGGYEVLMLGADVAASALAAAARKHEPHVICLTATMPGGSDRVQLAVHEVQQSWEGAGFVVGGRGLAPSLRPRPGIVLCTRVSEVVDAVDAVVKRAQLN